MRRILSTFARNAGSQPSARAEAKPGRNDHVTTSSSLPLIAVIATGGTIASTTTASGATTPSLGADALLEGTAAQGAELRAVNLMAVDSSSLTLADMQSISDEVRRQVEDDEVSAVIVLHGTDSMEETSLLTDLQLESDTPVVFTGSQFTAESESPDGPANVAAALAAALDPKNRGRGVLIAFGGRLLKAWGLTKASADRADAFRSVTDKPARRLHLPAPVAGMRVDTVAVSPGADATHLHASLEAGVQGIVLVGLGSGNASQSVVSAAWECQASDIPLVVSSRVPFGVLKASYGGGGGGHDLAVVGAIHAAVLRAGQARILLAALIANEATSEEIAAAFAAE